MELIKSEIVVISASYLLAGIPIGAILLAGKASPMYKLPFSKIANYWSWMALILVVTALIQDLV